MNCRLKLCPLLLLLILLLFVVAHAEVGKGAPRSAPAKRAKILTPDQVVIKHTAEILGIAAKDLRTQFSFSQQLKPGDALDIVEIIMAIEDELSIEISDDALDRKVGAKGTADLPQKLTIRQLQELVRETLNKK